MFPAPGQTSSVVALGCASARPASCNKPSSASAAPLDASTLRLPAAGPFALVFGARGAGANVGPGEGAGEGTDQAADATTTWLGAGVGTAAGFCTNTSRGSAAAAAPTMVLGKRQVPDPGSKVEL
jgi:hypothetical protein